LIVIWQQPRPGWLPAYPFLHDPLTIAALCAPELLRFEVMTARALTHGPLRGFMVPRLMNGPLVNAAVDIQAQQAREWVMERLLG
jgi:inosine-uridine nucleoside N-ribohydrolase